MYPTWTKGRISVCKTIKQKIPIVFYDMKCSKCSGVRIWTSSTTWVSFFGISKLLLYFPLTFMSRYWSNDSTLLLSKIYYRSVIQMNELYRLKMDRKVTYSKFQNCYFFTLRYILKEVLLKYTQTNQKIFTMDFIFLTKLQVEGLLYKYFP